MNRRSGLKLVVGTWLFGSMVAHAAGVCVKSTKAVLRVGPGLRYSVTWEVGRFMPFRKLGDRGWWLLVEDLEGDKHWIRTREVTRRLRCAVVKVPKAVLRTGPGRKYRRFAKYPAADKYESFRILRKTKGWYQLTDDYGDKVWAWAGVLWVP